MKILFLSWNYPPALGGIEYVVANLFQGLRDRGHDVTLVTTSSTNDADEAGVVRASRPGLLTYLWFCFRRSLSLCRKSRPDVIACGSVVTSPVAAILSRWFRIPMVVLMHGSDILHKGLLYQVVVRWSLRRATGLCANSAMTQKLLVEAGFEQSLIEVIHPGVCTEDFEKCPDSGAEEILQELTGHRVLLTVGRLIRRKGVLEFVERVMPQLCQQYPELVYLIVGDDAKDSLVHRERLRDRIVGRAKELGLAKNVRLPGALPNKDLVRLFFRSDIFVLPCIDVPGDVEGFGIVFSEAALADTPSVATRSGGIPEAVEDRLTGLLVDVGDYAGLTDAIRKLLDDESLRMQLAQAGAERAKNLLGWNVIVGKYVDVLKRVTRERS